MTMTPISRFAVRLLWIEILVIVVLTLGVMMPLPGGVSFKVVQSGSMAPALSIGSMVVVVPAATYRAGDIITFDADSRENVPITHRVERVTKKEGSTFYVTKGDANKQHDSVTTAYHEVIGRVAYTIPHLGYVLDVVRSPIGFVSVVVIPAGIILWYELLVMRRVNKTK